MAPLLSPRGRKKGNVPNLPLILLFVLVVGAFLLFPKGGNNSSSTTSSSSSSSNSRPISFTDTEGKGASPTTTEVAKEALAVSPSPPVAKEGIAASKGTKNDGAIGAGIDKSQAGYQRLDYLKSKTTRDGLERRVSSVPGGSSGLFTTKVIERGGFVGFYCGAQYTNYERMNYLIPRERSTYNFGVHETTVVADPENERNKMCFMNEPLKGVEPNIDTSFYYLETPKPDRSGYIKRAAAAAFWANRRIEAGEELFFYYGQNYEEYRKEQGYEVDAPGVSSLSEADKQDPGEVLSDYMPIDCFVMIKHTKGFVPFV